MHVQKDCSIDSLRRFALTSHRLTIMMWTLGKDKLIRTHRANSVRALRSGMTKDQLIFVIICSAALLVAAVTLVHFFVGSSRKDSIDTEWHCLACGNDFGKKTKKPAFGGAPSANCPKCGGEAARVVYRKCPNCGEEVQWYRLRSSKTGHAQEEGMGGQSQPTSQPMVRGAQAMVPDTEIQFRVKLADGSYGWTDWMNSMGAQQKAVQKDMHCSECGALLFPR